MPGSTYDNIFIDWKKAVLIRMTIKIKCLTNKAFSGIYYGSCFFIINSGNQKLIRHINCFGDTFCHQSKTMKFCWFRIFLSFGLYFEFYSLSVLCIYYSIIHSYNRYDLLLQQHFSWHLLYFYVHYCLPKMNTSCTSIQQVFQLQQIRFPVFIAND